MSTYKNNQTIWDFQYDGTSTYHKYIVPIQGSISVVSLKPEPEKCNVCGRSISREDVEAGKLTVIKNYSNRYVLCLDCGTRILGKLIAAMEI
jgi:hypothetical protein